jgi:hypothetical protein
MVDRNSRTTYTTCNPTCYRASVFQYGGHLTEEDAETKMKPNQEALLSLSSIIAAPASSVCHHPMDIGSEDTKWAQKDSNRITYTDRKNEVNVVLTSQDSSPTGEHQTRGAI